MSKIVSIVIFGISMAGLSIAMPVSTMPIAAADTVSTAAASSSCYDHTNLTHLYGDISNEPNTSFTNAAGSQQASQQQMKSDWITFTQPVQGAVDDCTVSNVPICTSIGLYVTNTSGLWGNLRGAAGC